MYNIYIYIYIMCIHIYIYILCIYIYIYLNDFNGEHDLHHYSKVEWGTGCPTFPRTKIWWTDWVEITEEKTTKPTGFDPSHGGNIEMLGCQQNYRRYPSLGSTNMEIIQHIKSTRHYAVKLACKCYRKDGGVKMNKCGFNCQNYTANKTK